MSNAVEYLGNMQWIEILILLLIFMKTHHQLMGLHNMKHRILYFPLSPVELGSCCSDDVSQKYHFPSFWRSFRAWSRALTPVWFVGISSLALECIKESTDGVKGRGGSEDAGARLLCRRRTAASLCLPAWCGCLHNSIQSSDLNYTPTPRAVWYNRLCAGGLEEWVYREFRDRFVLDLLYVIANHCPRIHNGTTEKLSLKPPHVGLLDFRHWKPGSGM